MIGVVLWKNIDEGSAVIWCEDQGDLAYLNNNHACQQDADVFDVGDVVRFDVQEKENLRRAENLSRLESATRTELAQALHSKPSRQTTTGANVLPFKTLEYAT